MLSISNLSHVYPNGTRALSDVSLEIPRGMYGLLGPNGAGKSTLMRCIATLQAPSSGSIRFDDDGSTIDVVAEPERLRSTLGYLPQDFGVYPRVTAIDMLDHLPFSRGCRIAVSGARRSRGCWRRSTCGTYAKRRWLATRAACGSGSASHRR